MDAIKSLGLIISLLMVLMAYIKQLIPDGKVNGIMKMILATFIMLSMIEGVRNFDFSKVRLIYEKSYNDDAWNETVDLIESGLMNEMNDFLEDQAISAEVLTVEVQLMSDKFEISQIILSGNDTQAAKNILSGRYQINKDNIEVKNE
ncbi:MAG: hypothetical protein IKK30_06195 [Clostridia bacterium]|nr:hypothetical protein [Clostridia bacterium]